jgi:hypothetical protein
MVMVVYIWPRPSRVNKCALKRMRTSYFVYDAYFVQRRPPGPISDKAPTNEMVDSGPKSQRVTRYVDCECRKLKISLRVTRELRDEVWRG